ncbi:MAG: GtrA family protein, partial [Lachnospiraceae bacterium]|nr:GtrA family protein [Lachnospiraceae bacterium]
SGGLDLVLANTAAWIAAVAFAFVTNKLYVFESKDRTRSAVLSELVPFVTCRLLSLVMETLILYVTVTLLRFNEPLMKILSGILVIIVNYFASKYLIFRKEKDAPASGEETE